MQTTTPQRFYKYYDLNVQSLKSLKRQVLYFGSPKNFNDPYDCTIQVALSELSDQDVETLRCHYLSRSDLPSSAKHDFLTASVTKLRQQLIDSVKATLTHHRDEFLKTKGVCCFTEGVENLLLWAHYAGKYRGFCLEFDAAKDAQLAQKLRKVDYVDRPPVIDTMEILHGQKWDAIIQKLFCTKSDAWAYEKEWRAIHVEAGTEYCYPAEALTGVYFGPEIDFTSMEIIALILGGQNPNVALWKGTRRVDVFKVAFEKMTYTPHIVAKHMQPQGGLLVPTALPNTGL